MMQRLTSNRLGRQAYFRSLLMLGLLAGSTCTPLASLSAQSLNGMSGLSSASSTPAKLPMASRSASMASREADVPRHLVHLLGLRSHHTAAIARLAPRLSQPSLQHSEFQQVQYESSPLPHGEPPVRADRASAAAGVVAHAYLAQGGVSASQQPGQSPVRSLNSALAGAGNRASGKSQSKVRFAQSSADKDSSVVTQATNNSETDGDLPVVGGPVKYDPSLADAGSGAAETMPQAESESLLDVDLSALTAQGPLANGPLAAGQGSKTSGRAPTVSLLVEEESSPKLIGTERGSLSNSKPVTRAPQLVLSDDSHSTEEIEITPRPIRAHLASSTASPTRVKIHETFTSQPANSGQSFHLSDAETSQDRETGAAIRLPVSKPVEVPKSIEQPKLASRPQQVSQPQMSPEARPLFAQQLPEAPTLPTGLTLAEGNTPSEEHGPLAEPKKVDAPKPIAAQALPALALAPQPLPVAPALPAVPQQRATAGGKPAAELSLTAPFEPGTEGLVVKASRPGLEQRQPSSPTAGAPAAESVALQPEADLSESPAPEIASSSSAHRVISLRIGAAAPSTQATSEADSEQHSLSDNNPIALSAPVVRPVKRITPEPSTRPAAATMLTGQPTAGPETSKQSQLVQKLMAEITKTFPSSRVELKADEEDEGLVAEGVAASESEAKKILAMVRKTALCPVADHIITKR